MTGPGRLLAILTEGGVRFVLVGGFAVIAHGVARATLDVDVVVEPAPESHERLAAVMDSLEAPALVEDLIGLYTDLDPRDSFDLARGIMIRIPTKYGILDLVNRPLGAPDWTRLAAAAGTADVDGARILVAGLEDLVAMKRASGRPKDLLDVAELTRRAG